jgi:hypothetical protein
MSQGPFPFVMRVFAIHITLGRKGSIVILSGNRGVHWEGPISAAVPKSG